MELPLKGTKSINRRSMAGLTDEQILDRKREQAKVAQRKYRVKHKEKIAKNRQAANLWAKYRVTVGQYNAMLKKQEGVCAICLEECRDRKVLCVDHDHKTGKVRGLLCNSCNRGIGLLKDDPDILRNAAWYLGGTQ